MKKQLIIVTAGMLFATACSGGQSGSNETNSPVCSASCTKEAVVKLLHQDKELADSLQDRMLRRKADETIRQVNAKPQNAGNLYAKYIWDITGGLSKLSLVVEMSGLPDSESCRDLRNSILNYGKKYGAQKKNPTDAKLNQLAKQFYDDRSRPQGQCMKLIK
jgi:hypothetical protein